MERGSATSSASSCNASCNRKRNTVKSFLSSSDIFSHATYAASCHEKGSKITEKMLETLPVDLRLASTYVPAVACLARAAVLILFISRYPQHDTRVCSVKLQVDAFQITDLDDDTRSSVKLQVDSFQITDIHPTVWYTPVAFHA